MHNFTEPFLGDTGIMKCRQAVFDSCSGYCWPFSDKSPERKDLLLLREHNGARFLFEEKIHAEMKKSAA